MNLPLAAYGGAGIGLLFGVIMGTSITPTVATLLGVLTTMLGGILGLNDALFNDAKAARIGSFGVACVLGAYLGLFVRSHNLLAPSIEDLKKSYVAAGFSEEQALNFIAMKEFGVPLSQLDKATQVALPSGFAAPVADSGSDVGTDFNTDMDTEAELEAESTADASAALPPSKVASPASESQATQPETVASVIFKRHNNLLFGAAVDVSGCEELVHTDPSLALDEVLNNFELTGGAWESLMLSVYDSLPEAQQKPVLLLVKDAVCRIKVDEINDCGAALATLDATDATWLTDLSQLNQEWASVAEEIQLTDLPFEQSRIAFGHIHNMLCRNEKGETAQ